MPHEVPVKEEKPHATDPEKSGEIQPAHVEFVRIESGHHHPPNVDDMSDKHRCRDRREHTPGLFHLPGEQEKERAEKVKEDKENEDVTPATCDPMAVPRNLMRKVT